MIGDGLDNLIAAGRRNFFFDDQAQTLKHNIAKTITGSNLAGNAADLVGPGVGLFKLGRQALRGSKKAINTLDDALAEFEGVAPTRGNAGHQYATEVLDGGAGRTFAGHGELRAGSGDVLIPEGTSLTIPRDGIKILDRTAGYIERGDWDGLIELAKVDPRVADDVFGMATYLPGSRVPNYTLKAPVSLRVYQASDTVEDATSLLNLLEKNMGNRCWAACTEFRR